MTLEVGRREILAGGAVAAAASVIHAGAASAASSASQEVASEEPQRLIATRAELEAICDRYVQALVAHDPSQAPFAANARFAENDVILPLGEASWRTFERFGRYRHYFADPQNGEVGLIANAYEMGGGCVFVLRVKVDDDKRITEAEQFVARDPNGADAYEKLGAPDPVWLEPIPPAQRQSHEALRAVSFMYFEALSRNDGAGVYPFRDDCERIEHARPTVSQPQVEGYGHSDAATVFTTLDARAQYRFGMMAFVTEIRDRETLVVDVERGAVLGTSFYDYDGALRKIDFANEQDWVLPPYFRSSRSHHANEGFKIVNGSFRYVEMTFIEVPYGTKHAFPGPAQTVALDYDPPRPLPAPASVGSPADYDGLTARLLDAMARNCACDLPLAHGVRYTENGVPVEIGVGLWQSLDGLREYGVALADPVSRQGGWFGTLDERTLFAAMALRYNLADGLIDEIEAVVARPQKPAVGRELATATFTMFTPPLEHDLFAGAFDATASAPGQVRVNGHPVAAQAPLPPGVTLRGRRLWLADSPRGLQLDLAVLDNTGAVPGAPPDRSAPWTDLHARLSKGDGAEGTETLVVRVPYGQGTGWSR